MVLILQQYIRYTDTTMANMSSLYFYSSSFTSAFHSPTDEKTRYDCLKKKKTLEMLLVQNTNKKDTLLHILHTIHEKHTDNQILEAYKQGMIAIKELSKSGITPDKVQDVMDELKELLEDQNDIDEVIKHGVGQDDDDLSLQEELDKLAEEMKLSNEVQEPIKSKPKKTEFESS